MARSTSAMNSSQGLSAGVLLGLGLLGGCGLMALLSQLAADDSSSTQGGLEELSPAVARMSDQLEQMGDQQSEVLRRVTDLELAWLAGPGSERESPLALNASAEDLAALRESVLEISGSLGQDAGLESSGGPVVNQVIEAMKILESQQDAERDAERAQRRQERVDALIEALTESLGLDGNQELSMTKLLTDSAAKRTEIDDIESRTDRRDERDALAAQTEASLAGILSPSQLQQLQDQGGLDTGGRRGGFGGGGGGGRGR